MRQVIRIRPRFDWIYNRRAFIGRINWFDLLFWDVCLVARVDSRGANWFRGSVWQKDLGLQKKVQFSHEDVQGHEVP